MGIILTLKNYQILYLMRIDNKKSYSLTPKVEFYRNDIRYLFSLELDI